jgi:hypothetical protein
MQRVTVKEQTSKKEGLTTQDNLSQMNPSQIPVRPKKSDTQKRFYTEEILHRRGSSDAMHNILP